MSLPFTLPFDLGGSSEENPMAYVHATTSVGTTATLIATVEAGDRLALYSSAACFVGGPGVTSSGATQGLPIPATTVVELPALGGSLSNLYAVVASSTANVSVLYVA